ncbi:MMPL family transporter [Streptomyces sp. NPDC020192]|uniref:MMPL family transporter n=1 Tax=Streptomyces sp. NPDC020192 TaxID=3365066 RepID=UPI0037A96E3F
MATFLYRLGRLAFRRRRLFLMAWIVVLAAVGIGAGSVSGTTTDDFTLPGTQSQKAVDLLGKEFPQASAAGATARVVFEAPGGQKLSSATSRSEIASLVGELKATPQVASVSEPFSSGLVSKDGTIAYAQVTYDVPKADLTDAAHDALNKVAKEGEKAGLSVSLGGNAVQDKAKSKAGELIGLAVAAVVLVITFGSMIAAGLPLVTAVFGVVAAILCITIATSFVDMASASSTLALMLGLAVAIDYALFIVSRYRSEIREGHEPEEAAGRAGTPCSPLPSQSAFTWPSAAAPSSASASASAQPCTSSCSTPSEPPGRSAPAHRAGSSCTPSTTIRPPARTTACSRHEARPATPCAPCSSTASSPSDPSASSAAAASADIASGRGRREHNRSARPVSPKSPP